MGTMDWVVYGITAVLVVAGALGVVIARNPVHSALSLVGTLFGVAVLFVTQDAFFLAAVQVIVYAGAIVVLFLFVIMLLGVDRAENLSVEPLVGQRPVAVVAGLATAALLITFLVGRGQVLVDQESVSGPIAEDSPSVAQIGRVLFTDYVFAFEATAILLTIGVVSAVLLGRRAKEDDAAVTPPGEGHIPAAEATEGSEPDGAAVAERT